MSIPVTKPGHAAMNGTLTLPKPPPRDFSTSSKGSTSGIFSQHRQTQRLIKYDAHRCNISTLGSQSESSQRSHTQQQPPQQGSQTLKPRKPKPPQRHSAGNIDYDNTDGEEGPVSGFRTRSKTVSDAPGKCPSSTMAVDLKQDSSRRVFNFRRTTRTIGERQKRI